MLFQLLLMLPAAACWWLLLVMLAGVAAADAGALLGQVLLGAAGSWMPAAAAGLAVCAARLKQDCDKMKAGLTPDYGKITAG